MLGCGGYGGRVVLSCGGYGEGVVVSWRVWGGVVVSWRVWGRGCSVMEGMREGL